MFAGCGDHYGMSDAPRSLAAAAFLAHAGSPFRSAAAREAGVSRRQLSGAKLIIPTRGVRTVAPLQRYEESAAALALVLPDDVAFSHLTAARLHGLSLPWRLERLDVPVEVMRATAKAKLERTACVSHRGLERRAVEQMGQLQVTAVADTWCDIIEKYHRMLTLEDAVMLGDAAVELIQRTRPEVDELGRFIGPLLEIHPRAAPGSADWLTDPANGGIHILAKLLASRPGFRGNVLAAAALPLLRPRVWSPMETRSRLAIVDGGIREPRLNATVRDSLGVILIGDHVWEEEQVVGEYNGPTHEASRHQDNSKRLRLEDQGWWLLEIYKNDVLNAVARAQFLGRLRDGLTRRRRPSREWP